MGRTATGVIGIRLDGDDQVVGMERLAKMDRYLWLQKRGYGKRTDIKSTGSRDGVERELSPLMLPTVMAIWWG